jgi:hypothetical protein
MDLNDFAVDPTTYENGKKIEFGGGTHIGVRSAGADRAQKVRERLWKPYASWKEVPADIQAKINANWLAQGLLTEFVGFTVDGKPFEVDLSKPEDQKRLGDLLGQPKYKAFRSKVLGIALDEGNFQAAADQAAEGN